MNDTFGIFEPVTFKMSILKLSTALLGVLSLSPYKILLFFSSVKFKDKIEGAVLKRFESLKHPYKTLLQILQSFFSASVSDLHC